MPIRSMFPVRSMFIVLALASAGCTVVSGPQLVPPVPAEGGGNGGGGSGSM